PYKMQVPLHLSHSLHKQLVCLRQAVHKPFQLVDMKHPQSLLQLPVHSPLNLLSLPSPLNPHQVLQFSSNQLLIFFYLTTTSTTCNRFQQSANITKKYRHHYYIGAKIRMQWMKKNFSRKYCNLYPISLLTFILQRHKTPTFIYKESLNRW